MSYNSHIRDGYLNTTISTNTLIDGYVALQAQASAPPAISGFGTMYSNSTDGQLYYTSPTGSVIAIGSSTIIGSALSVKEAPFYAKGDGITDDTAAIQLALNDAYASGQYVFIPPGTYLINASGLNVPSYTTIVGVPQLSVMYGTGNANSIFIISNSTVEVIIKDLGFLSTGVSGTAAKCGIVGGGLDSIVIDNCFFNGFLFPIILGNNLIPRNPVTRATIKNCQFINTVSVAIDGRFAKSAIINNNFYSAPGAQSISLPGPCYDILIANNIIDNHLNGLNLSGVTGTYGINYINNTITNSTGTGGSGGVVTVFSCSDVNISGNIIDTFAGNAAIYVYSSTQGFSIIGNTILYSGANIPYGIQVGAGSQCLDGTIVGNNISRRDGYYSGSGAIHLIDGYRITVSANTISNIVPGILLNNGSLTTPLSEINISNNIMSIDPSLTLFGSLSGLDFAGVDFHGASIKVSVQDNTISGYNYGFYITSGTGTGGGDYVIRNNVIHGALQIGQDVSAAAVVNVLIENNLLDSGNNVWTTNGTNVVARNNRLYSTSFSPTSIVISNSVDVSQVDTVEPSNGSTINNFINGYLGQIVKVKCTVVSATISNNANIVLVSGSNFVMTTGSTLTLVQFDAGVWTEVARSVAGATPVEAVSGANTQVAYFNNANTITSSSNFTFDGYNVVAKNIFADGYVALQNQITDPTNTTNFGTLYTKADGRLYFNSPLGIETVAGGLNTTGIINVKDYPYNAKGDGVTNDTTAINQAITDAAADGYSVFIPQGTYVVTADTIRIPSNIEIFGQFNKTILTSSTVSGEFIFTSNSGANNIYIHDLNFTTVDSASAIFGSIACGNNDNVIIQRCKFSNFYYYGFRSVAPVTRCLLIDNEAHHIYQSSVSTGLDPAYFQDSIVARNYIHDIQNPNNTSHAIYASGQLYNVAFVDNIIDTCTTGLEIGTSGGGSPSANLVVARNIITNVPGIFPIQIVQANNVSVTENVVYGSEGIDIFDSYNCVISANTIILNNLPLTSGANGISVNTGSYNCTIVGNTLNRTDATTRGNGISISSGTNHYISNNNITNLHTGIYLVSLDAYGIGKISISNNNIQTNLTNQDGGGNVYTGVYIDGYVYNAVINNNIIDTFPDAVVINTDGSGVGTSNNIVINNNYLYNVSAIGYDTVASGVKNLIIKDNIMDSGNNVWVTANPTNNVIYSNNRLLSTSFGANTVVTSNNVDVSQTDLIEPPNGSTINNFINGYLGQVIKVKCTVASITISNNANIVLTSGSNFIMTTGSTLLLVQFDAGVWTEVARSVSGATPVEAINGINTQVAYFANANEITSSPNFVFDGTNLTLANDAYGANFIISPNTGTLQWSGSTIVKAPANGTLQITSASGGFGTLLLGAAGSTTGIEFVSGNGVVNVLTGSGTGAITQSAVFRATGGNGFISSPLGSATTAVFTNNTSGNTGTYFPTSTSWAVTTNGIQALSIDNLQNSVFSNTITIGVSGTVAIPALNIDGYAGIYSTGTGNLSLEVGGSNVFSVNTSSGPIISSIKIGPGAVVANTNSIIIGSAATETATGNSNIAIGQSSSVNGTSSSAIAIGAQSASQALNAIAIGFASGIGNGGSNSFTGTGSGSIAIGSNTSAAGVRTVAIGNQADGYNYTTAVVIGASAIGTGNNSISIGVTSGFNSFSTIATGANNVAIGQSATISASNISNAISIGPSASAQGNGAVVIGSGASGTGVVIGANAITTSSQGGIAIGANASALSSAFNAIAIGDNSATLSSSSGAIAIGNSAGLGNGGINTFTGVGSTSVAVGFKSSAAGSSSIAIGNGADGYNYNSAIAIGSSSVVAGLNSIAIGASSGLTNSSTTTTGANNISIGVSSLIGGTNISNALIIGQNASVGNNNSIVIGKSSSETSGAGGSNIIIGNTASTSNSAATNTIVIGTSATSAQGSGVVIGSHATDSSSGGGNVNIVIGNAASQTGSGVGHGVVIGSSASSTQASVVLGFGAQDASAGSGGSNVVIGISSKVSGTNITGASAIGAASAVGTNAVALGNNAGLGTGIAPNIFTGVALNSTALGAFTSAAGSGSISIGYQADGYNYTNAVTIGPAANSTGNSSITIGSSAGFSSISSIASGSNNIAIGNTAMVSSTSISNAIAIGPSSSVSANSALAFGISATATGNQSVALGPSASTGSSNYDIAIGSSANANSPSNAAIAIGRVSSSLANNAIAIGASSSAGSSASNSVAIGQAASASNSSSVAIGQSSSATGSSSIALGLFAGLGSGGINTFAGVGASSIGIGISTSAAGTGAVVLGNNADGYSYNNVIVIGSGSISPGAGSVSIGASSGLTSVGTTTTGANNVVIGSLAIISGTNVSNAVVIGQGANVGGNTSTALGSAATTSTFTNSTALGYNATATANNQIVLGTSAETLLIPGVQTGVRLNLTTQTTNYSVLITDYTILANAASGSITITLPTAVGVSGQVYVIKKIDSSGNTVTIATTSSQTIDGATTQIINIQNASITVQSNGSNWFII